MNQKRLQLLHRLRKITINQPIPGHHDLIAGKIVIDEIQVDTSGRKFGTGSKK